MTEHWTTDELPGLLWDPDAEPPDDDPWPNPPTPNRTPTKADLRHAELSDLHNQGAGLHGLYTATTIHAPEYL